MKLDLTKIQVHQLTEINDATAQHLLDDWLFHERQQLWWIRTLLSCNKPPVMSTSRQETTKKVPYTPVLTTNMISLLMSVSDLFKIVRRSKQTTRNGFNLETPVRALLRRMTRLVAITTSAVVDKALIVIVSGYQFHQITKTMGIIFALTVICKSCRYVWSRNLFFGQL